MCWVWSFFELVFNWSWIRVLSDVNRARAYSRSSKFIRISSVGWVITQSKCQWRFVCDNNIALNGTGWVGRGQNHAWGGEWEYSPRISDKTSHVMRHLVHIATGYKNLTINCFRPSKMFTFITWLWPEFSSQNPWLLFERLERKVYITRFLSRTLGVGGRRCDKKTMTNLIWLNTFFFGLFLFSSETF